MRTIRGQRRQVVAGALAALGLALCVPAAPAAAASDDMSLGAANAPVTVVEYASLGCPHCAFWAAEQFPRFKARYIDTGRVRYELREVLTGDPNLAAAGFLTARCAGPAKYFQVVDAVYKAQTEVDRQRNAYIVLLGIAKDAGLDQARFDACLADPAGNEALNARVARARAAGVTGTPTFEVNGRRLDGIPTAEELGAAIALAGAR